MEKDLEYLYFEYNKKSSEIEEKEQYLHSLQMDTFVLNKKVSETIKQIKELEENKELIKDKINQIENVEDNNGERKSN